MALFRSSSLIITLILPFRRLPVADHQACVLARRGGGASLVHPRLHQCQGAAGEGHPHLGRKLIAGVPGQDGFHRSGGRGSGAGLWVPVEAFWGALFQHACWLHWARCRPTPTGGFVMLDVGFWCLMKLMIGVKWLFMLCCLYIWLERWSEVDIYLFLFVFVWCENVEVMFLYFMFVISGGWTHTPTNSTSGCGYCQEQYTHTNSRTH